ncbi:MAG: alanine racemase [Pseudomonadales bacterium]
MKVDGHERVVPALSALSRRKLLTGAAVAGAVPWFARAAAATGSFDAWLEINDTALVANAREAARAAGGRPVCATVKNNGYGLGLERVARVLDQVPEVSGLAVVKVDEAMRLAHLGVSKPILLMARASNAEAEELVRRGVQLAPFWDGDGEHLSALAATLDRPVPVHLYIDTGMSRMGIPYHRALPWAADLAARPGVRIHGAFTGLTEDHEFDREQVRRLQGLAADANARGFSLGRLHAASSDALANLPEAHLDMVRPGIMLFGAHADGSHDAGILDITPAFRLRAPVVRVERLRPGDTVSYGRSYVAQAPLWIATIPVGHSDGYPRQAVGTCRILIGARTYPVIGFVSASHCIVEIGPERLVEPGAVATLIGPDHPDIHPNEIANRSGRSVYDVLMHLSAQLPVRTWS